MPQIDIGSFFFQIFSCFLVFNSFFYLFSYLLLPRILLILNFRLETQKDLIKESLIFLSNLFNVIQVKRLFFVSYFAFFSSYYNFFFGKFLSFIFLFFISVQSRFF